MIAPALKATGTTRGWANPKFFDFLVTWPGNLFALHDRVGRSGPYCRAKQRTPRNDRKKSAQRDQCSHLLLHGGHLFWACGPLATLGLWIPLVSLATIWRRAPLSGCTLFDGAAPPPGYKDATLRANALPGTADLAAHAPRRVRRRLRCRCRCRLRFKLAFVWLVHPSPALVVNVDLACRTFRGLSLARLGFIRTTGSRSWRRAAYAVDQDLISWAIDRRLGNAPGHAPAAAILYFALLAASRCFPRAALAVDQDLISGAIRIGFLLFLCRVRSAATLFLGLRNALAVAAPVRCEPTHAPTLT